MMGWSDQSISFQQRIGIGFAPAEGDKEIHRVEGITPGQDVFSEVLSSFLIEYSFFFK